MGKELLASVRLNRVRNRPVVRPGDPALKDQLHLTGATEVEVLADHVLEKDTASGRAAESG